MFGFIYMTTNNINGKKYIGQKKYDKRGVWKTYLGSGDLILHAIKKYGKENFSKVIIDEANNQQELDEKEKYWIKYYNAVKSKEFYNLAIGGNHPSRDHLTDKEFCKSETKRITRLIQAHPFGEDVPVSVLTEDEVLEIINLLLVGEPPINIASLYGVSRITINDIKLHKTWRHLTDDIVFPKTDESKRKGKKKPVVQYSLDGEVVAEYKSAVDAEAITGISRKLISAVCCGEKRVAHDYVWRFKNDPFDLYNTKRKSLVPVDMYDLDNNYIRTFSSIKDAQKYIGKTGLGVSLDNPNRTCGGYKFKRHNVA